MSVSDKERSFMVGFTPHLFISIIWGKTVNRVSSNISPSESNGGRKNWRGISPHMYSPHVSLSVSDGGGKDGWGDSPHTFRIIWGESRLIGRSTPHLWIRIWWGKKGNLPQIYLSVLDGEKECVMTVSLGEISITCDFLQNPPSWRAYFGSNPHVSLAENLTVFGR